MLQYDKNEYLIIVFAIYKKNSSNYLDFKYYFLKKIK